MVVKMSEEENNNLKNTFITYLNHFINNTTQVIDNSNADKSTKDEYEILLSSLAKHVHNILFYGIVSNNIEEEIEELIEKAERIGIYVAKGQLVKIIINYETPLIPDKYKNLIDIDYYGINLKHDSLKNKIIFFIKKSDILKELDKNQKIRSRREEELIKLSIKELIQLAKKYNLDLDATRRLVALRIAKVVECIRDPNTRPGTTC